MGGVLSVSPKKEIINKKAIVDGTSCVELGFIIEVNADGNDIDTHKQYVKTWIDTSRNYRPLRIEHYTDQCGIRLRRVIDSIKLEQVSGVWLPIQGRDNFYSVENIVLEEGYTEDEIKNMGPEEALKHVRYIIKPEDQGEKLIDINNWSVGQDIDDALFTIDYPDGSIIWDDYLQTALHIGDESKNIPLLSQEDIKEQPENSKTNDNSPKRTNQNNTNNSMVTYNIAIPVTLLMMAIIVCGMWYYIRAAKHKQRHNELGVL